MEDHALSSRPGLPEALRVLIRNHPRAAWRGHDNFGPLIQFWLERHMMFRSLSERLITDTQLRMDHALDTQEHHNRLSRLGSVLLGELQGHHQIEDHHYFPKLMQLDARLEDGFALLDADHHALDPMMHGLADTANAVLRGGEAGRFLEEIQGFERLLNRHLEDEEDLIVPVLLTHGEHSVG